MKMAHFEKWGTNIGVYTPFRK